MVSGFMDLTSSHGSSLSYPVILKVGTPTGVYTDKQIEELYRRVRTHVGDEFLPVVVPKDVELEIIV